MQPNEPLQQPTQPTVPQQPTPPTQPAMPTTQQQPYQQPAPQQYGPAPAAAPIPADSSKRRLPKWLKILMIVIAALVVFIIVIFAIVGVGTKAPQKVSDQFLNDVQAGDTQAAYSLTSTRFQEATPESKLESVIAQVKPGIQGTEKVTGKSIETSNDTPSTAIFTYEITTSNGKSYAKTELQKDGGAWRIINFNSAPTPFDTSL